MNVWADMRGGVVTYDEAEGDGGGLPDIRKGAFRALVDQDEDLQVGKQYEAAGAGLNRYEACLCVREGGATRYYPGGVEPREGRPEFDSPRAVVEGLFKALVDATWIVPEKKFVILRILHRWGDR